MATIQSQSTFEPVLDLAMGVGRSAQQGPQDFIPVNTRCSRSRRDLVGSMLNQAKASIVRATGRILSLPVLRRRIGKTRRGKVIATTRTSSTELLETEGVAVVQGSAFGLGPDIPYFLRGKTSDLEEACKTIQRFCGNLPVVRSLRRRNRAAAHQWCRARRGGLARTFTAPSSRLKSCSAKLKRGSRKRASFLLGGAG